MSRRWPEHRHLLPSLLKPVLNWLKAHKSAFQAPSERTGDLGVEKSPQELRKRGVGRGHRGASRAAAGGESPELRSSPGSQGGGRRNVCRWSFSLTSHPLLTPSAATLHTPSPFPLCSVISSRSPLRRLAALLLWSCSGSPWAHSQWSASTWRLLGSRLPGWHRLSAECACGCRTGVSVSLLPVTGGYSHLCPWCVAPLLLKSGASRWVLLKQASLLPPPPLRLADPSTPLPLVRAQGTPLGPPPWLIQTAQHLEVQIPSHTSASLCT